jgi:hypothetical protein
MPSKKEQKGVHQVFTTEGRWREEFSGTEKDDHRL